MLEVRSVQRNGVSQYTAQRDMLSYCFHEDLCIEKMTRQANLR